MKIRPIDVIRNIENHKDLWDIELKTGAQSTSSTKQGGVGTVTGQYLMERRMSNG